MMPKLLLADDSITVQRVIALTFQGEGIEVIAVGDGDQAVAAIDRERPQIVLADLSMPGRDGYAVAEHVKRSPELARDTRVVLLTGAAEPVEEARSRTLGIDGVLSKPFEPQVATALVRRLLAAPPVAPNLSPAVSQPAAAAASEPPPLAAAAVAANGAGGSMAQEPQDAIAVDDYFRRLDEALATAGLETTPDSMGDLAAIAGVAPEAGAERTGDAETIIMRRQEPPASDEADDAGPKLVDAFSALLAAEEGDGAVVAGPVEMVGAPAPSPAVEWTSGVDVPPVDAVAETVAFQAVAAEAAVEAADAGPKAAETEAPAVAAAESAAPAAEAVAAEAADAPAVEAPEAAATVVLVPVPVAAAEPESGAAVDGPTMLVNAPAPGAPVVSPSPSPAMLRTDTPEQGPLDGIDLDEFADAVAQKILHRLTDARIDAIVSERVVEIAERLVREEIERIKADAQ
jgi:CheY-like chemotaxis protein